MAHFAEVNDRNEVVRVLVVADAQEHRGQAFLADDLGLGGRWVQTSYNGNIRKNFAGVGMYYDENRDAFTYPRPEPAEDYTFDEETCRWVLRTEE
jgi:hypothetical protein